MRSDHNSYDRVSDSEKTGKLRDVSELASTNEKSFDELFPPISKDTK